MEESISVIILIFLTRKGNLHVDQESANIFKKD